MVLLIVIFTGVNNAYWITIYNVTYLAGNKFLNGIILGLSELTSGIFAGLIIEYTTPSAAFQLCSVFGIAFMWLNQFVAPAGTIASYVTLLIAILGVGGVYTCIYVLIGKVMPKDQVGGAMVFIVTIGACASLMAPLIVLYPAPVPFFALAGFLVLAFACSCLLSQ